MNIGVNLLYLIPKVVGGTETYALNLLSSLSSQFSKHDKLILFCTNNNASLFSSIARAEISIIPINSLNRPIRLLAEQFILPFYCHLQGIDLLLSLGYSQPYFLPCKSITTIHDLNWYYCPEDYSWLSQQIIALTNKISIRKSSALIAVSTATKNALSKLFPKSRNKTYVIYHGSPLLSVKKSSSPYPNPYLFSLISHYPHKNLVTLMRVYKNLLKRFPNLHLVIGGTGNHADQEERQFELGNLSSPHLHLLPFVSDSELAQVYLHAAVFVFPSRYEGFGLPVLEAMHYGVPVVSSNAASLPEVIGKGGALVNPSDVSAYVREISKILKNQKFRDRQKLAGILQANTFSWEKCATETYNLIKDTYDKK